MADTGEWELVGKPSKKNKNASVANGKLSKEEKKQFLSKAPRVIPTVSTSPVKYFPGCIDVEVIGKENRLPNSPKAVSEPTKKKPEKKKKKDNALHQPGTLEEAVRRLSVAQMQNLLDVVVSRFHDSPLIWLKDLASYLNVRVNPIHSPDPAFRGQPLDYPVSHMNEEVKKLVLSTVSGCSDGVLAAFHKHCVQAMVQEQVKGLGVVGYKIFIQILAMHRPEVGVMNLPFYCELRHDLQSQTPACLSLLWAVGQSGVGNFTIGLRVWLELMMPVIGLKNYSSLVVEYGSMVFGGGAGESGNVLGVRQFYSIFDFTWTTSASLPKSVQRQLFALYPKVKTTAFSSSPENTLRNFFPSFLRRLDPYAQHPLRVELLTCLVQCLTQDTQCWSIWSQLYLKHLPQSSILLHHLGEEWNVLGQSLRVQVKEAREAVEGFARSNKQLAVKSRAVTGVREATEATKYLWFCALSLKMEEYNIRLRFSYIKASNSYWRYGRGIARSTTPGEDGSEYSSREDLIDPPTRPSSSRRKKQTTLNKPKQRYKSGYSSSDDFLNEYDSDVTDGLMSSGLPETDGSVFSSREDLLDPPVKCSGNVSRFIRLSSSGKGSSVSRVSSRQDFHCDTLPQIKIFGEVPQNVNKNVEDIHCINNSEKNQQNETKKATHCSQGGDVRSESPGGMIFMKFGERSTCTTPRCTTPDKIVAVQQRVQTAVINTVHRLVSHIGKVQEEIGLVEEKCVHLKDTMCALEYDQYLLNEKLANLEEQFKSSCQHFSKSDPLHSNQEDISQTGNSAPYQCTPQKLFTRRNSVNEISDNTKRSTDKAQMSSTGMIITDVQFDSINSSTTLSDVNNSLSVSQDDFVLLSQMKVVQEKSKAKTPRIMKLLGILFVAAIIWDIKSAGSFYGSRVGQTVERLGVVPYLEAFGRASRKVFIQSYRWCVMNVPIMYSRSCELASPYLQLVVEKTSVVWGYCWGLLETAAAYVPVAKQKFETSLPGVSTALTHYGNVGWQLLQDGYANIREASAPYLLQAHQFLITKVFVGPLAPEKLQEHLVWAIDYVSQHLVRLHSGLVNALNDTTPSPKAV
ncbi:hypothetical protein Pmani_030039 [Petrolisthes manimaculis]|uniref:Transmembrane protein 214 n=1 Tax=Petrolisthes manimaculis TaxID=1843537 RepID=A0AAE1NXJ5_9EUCA|nr:hypothetical protein Pmani_030039 [Petrolisthes manimaculis]